MFKCYFTRMYTNWNLENSDYTMTIICQLSSSRSPSPRASIPIIPLSQHCPVSFYFETIIYAMLQLQIPTSVYPWEVCKVPKIEMSQQKPQKVMITIIIFMHHAFCWQAFGQKWIYFKMYISWADFSSRGENWQLDLENQRVNNPFNSPVLTVNFPL